MADSDARSVISRALAVLDAFRPGETTLPVAELVRRVGLPKSTVHRLVIELVHFGLLERTGREVALGIHLFELGTRVPARRRLCETSLPYMEGLRAATREDVAVGVLEGRDVVCLRHLYGDNRSGIGEGDRLPARATALGKAILAFSPRGVVVQIAASEPGRSASPTTVPPEMLLGELADVCRSGVAFTRDETAVGEAAVAAPILAGGSAVGALSISGPTTRFDPAGVTESLRTAANAVSRRLSVHPGIVEDWRVAADHSAYARHTAGRRGRPVGAP